MNRAVYVGLVLLMVAVGVACGQSSSSSTSSGNPVAAQQDSSSGPRGRQAEQAGAAVTLETSEALFDLATGLNACGYDGGLADSAPVRGEVRAEVAAVVGRKVAARDAQDKLCQYVREHELADRGRSVAQYVSLALYLTPPPALRLTVEQTAMPPDALNVVNLLPLLRAFAEEAQLHGIWLNHRAEYEAILDTLHDPLTKMILGTNIYLRVPVSSYDGRRFLVLVEPMLSAGEPNARIYATDYDIVTSPNAAGLVRLDPIRHLYLHYDIEPLVYARSTSVLRMTPLLKPVQNAPLDFTYKSDIVALMTECLIKAVEARTMEVGLARPVKPVGTRARVDLAKYDADESTYEREAETVRRKQVDLDMRQGWVLTEYFYGQMAAREHESVGLKEDMGEMVYGMDVGREQHHDEQIHFLAEGSGEMVRRVRAAPTGLVLAEKMMMEGDLDGAMGIADKALKDPAQDHAEAEYVKARVQLLEGDPVSSMAGFDEVLKNSRNPRTLAWAHVYKGRLYDTKNPPERALAVTQYKAAIAVPAVPPDAKAAAQRGVQVAFEVPKTVHGEDQSVDALSKAEKDAYRPEDEDKNAKPVAPAGTPKR